MSTVFELKIDNFILENKAILSSSSKKNKFRQSIEFHCILKNSSTEWKRIAFSHILPHPKSPKLKRKKCMVISDNTYLSKQVDQYIDREVHKIVTTNHSKYQLLIKSYINILNRTINKNQHLFDTNIIDICFKFYYSKQDEINILKNDTTNNFGICIKSLDEIQKIARTKKIVKQVFNYKKYAFFVISQPLQRQLLRYLAPYQNKIGRNPTMIRENDPNGFHDLMYNLKRKVVLRAKNNIKYESRIAVLSCAIGHICMNEKELKENILSLIIKILSVIKGYKNGINCGWKRIKKINIKTTHGKTLCLYNYQDIVSRYEMPDIVKKFNSETKRRYCL